jgi:hypothetical protein
VAQQDDLGEGNGNGDTFHYHVHVANLNDAADAQDAINGYGQQQLAPPLQQAPMAGYGSMQQAPMAGYGSIQQAPAAGNNFRPAAAPPQR